MSLARPARQQEKASLASVFLRFVGFLLFLGVVGSLVWSLSVTSGIDSFETLTPADAAPGVLVALPDGQAITTRKWARALRFCCYMISTLRADTNGRTLPRH